MDNDIKINNENETMNEKIHDEVLLFLGEELENIHKSSQGQTYDIEKEYSKTKKNKSPFVTLILVACFTFVIGLSFVMQKIISVQNQEIQVNLQKFDDLNLKNLLNTVSSAQNNYDSAVKTKATIEANMETKLKSAQENYENELFVLETMKLSKKQYEEQEKTLKQNYNQIVEEIHKEFDESIVQAEKQIQEYKKQLAEFDTAKIEAAREQEKALNSERQIRQLEIEKLTKSYEERISQINDSIVEIREQNNEEMRKTVTEISKKYQDELELLDPLLEDEKADSIIDETKMYEVENFDGQNSIIAQGIESEKVLDAMVEYQQLYDEYDYLDNAVAAIPQKNSIPEYVKASRSLVNAMGSKFIDTAVAFYDETENLKSEISSLNSEIDYKNQEIDGKDKVIAELNNSIESELKKQQSEYEETLLYLMGIQKTNAIILKVEDVAEQRTIELTEEEIQEEIKIRYETKMAEYEALIEEERQIFEQNRLQKEEMENPQTPENPQALETEQADENNPLEENEGDLTQEMPNQTEEENGSDSDDEQSQQIQENQQEDDAQENFEEDTEDEFVPSIQIPSEEELLEQIRSSIPATKTMTVDVTRIKVYVAPQADYLIVEEGAEAELRTAKPIKGKIFKDSNGGYYFEISTDKNGRLPNINYDELKNGLPIKIVAK